MIKLAIFIIAIIIVYNLLGRVGMAVLSAVIIMQFYYLLENYIMGPDHPTKVEPMTVPAKADPIPSAPIPTPLPSAPVPMYSHTTSTDYPTYSPFPGPVKVLDADEALMERMQYTGSQAKEAIDARARHSADKLRGLFIDELRANEDKDWWDENEEMDAQLGL